MAARTKHFDLVQGIRRLRSTLTTSTAFYHLYGHQDKHTPFTLLPRDVQLNILADSKAQQAFDVAHETSSFRQNVIFFMKVGQYKLAELNFRTK